LPFDDCETVTLTESSVDESSPFDNLDESGEAEGESTLALSNLDSPLSMKLDQPEWERLTGPITSRHSACQADGDCVESRVISLLSDHDPVVESFSDKTSMSDLMNQVASLTEELELAKLQVKALQEYCSFVRKRDTPIQGERQSTMSQAFLFTLAVLKVSVKIGAIAFGSLIVVSTMQRRPIGGSAVGN
jgi:hypothetical protein